MSVKDGSAAFGPRDATLIHQLATEAVRADLAELDELTTPELVELMSDDSHRVSDALSVAVPALSAAVDAIVERLEHGGRLVYVGAGTAGRIGVLDAAEAGPTFNAPLGQITAVLAGGLDVFATPAENVEDDTEAGAAAIVDLGVEPADVVVGISASGRTPYVLAAIEEARVQGAFTVGVVCNRLTPLSDSVDIAIEVPVGPEVIAGSTRLNAGTAQKVVLNILSTAAMVRMGKTYGNLMVDLRATNEKLRDRATRIVAEITGASFSAARSALEQVRWRPKEASLVLAQGLRATAATEALDDAGGRLRVALEAGIPNVGRAQPRPKAGAPSRLGVAGAIVGGMLVAGDVAIEEDRVVGVGLPGKGVGIAAPGLVDLQVNGFGGVDVLTGSIEELEEMSIALLGEGVIAYQPTLITSEPSQTIAAIARLEQLRQRPGRGAQMLGIHLEGPFLSPHRPGVHPVDLLRLPDEKLLGQLLSAGSVSMVTLAPELPGALELVATCRGRDVVVALGHSEASADQAEAAFAAGARAVTHLFNAMEPLSGRLPGLVGWALTRSDVAVQLIADGIHVADELIRLAFAAAGRRCSLVSDVVSAGGASEAEAHLGETPVAVMGGVARRADGTIAGAVAPLSVGLNHLVKLGFPLETAVNAVTDRPAQLIGDNQLGRLFPGSRADLVVLDEMGAVTRVLIHGREWEPC